MDPSQLEQNVRQVIESVYGTDVERFTITIENVYDEKVAYIHPFFKVVGRDKMMSLEKGMSFLRRGDPKIHNVVYNDDTVIVELSQKLLINPFKEIPILVELKLSDTTNGLKKIISHAEVFTVNGIVSSIPLVGFTYQSVAQPILGQLFTSAVRQFDQVKGKAKNVANTVHKETDAFKTYASTFLSKIPTPNRTEGVVQAESLHDETEGSEARSKSIPDIQVSGPKEE